MISFFREISMLKPHWGGSRGGSGGSVELPKVKQT